MARSVLTAERMYVSVSRPAVAATLAVTFVCNACSTTNVPPPPAPRPAMPKLEAPPPLSEGGLATVVLSTDVPARVERIIKNGTGRRNPSIETLLCEETPCTVTLPYGDHELDFTGTGRRDRHSRFVISVKRPSEVVNHVLGETTHPRGQEVATLLGVLGSLTLIVGVIVYAAGQKAKRESPGAVPLMISGGSLILGGIVVGALSPGTRHEGSTTQWTPAPEPTTSTHGRTIGASLGFHF